MPINASFGDGRSVSYSPSYAEQDENIQSNLAHKYDFATNPFLLASNLNQTFQPGIQNAQNQQRVNIAQAQQNLAKTYQDTMLPLQAQATEAQTDNVKAQGAMMAFQFGKAQDAYSQSPAYFQAVADANDSGDPSKLYSAAANFPAAAMQTGTARSNRPRMA